ncbi:hypothetical protein PV08_04197 [Exophiala spinifera]|uniref:Xanthine/uracil permease n=1 Tax=Exophiala spinifera TaxID=91928 RepID=A0A0D1YPD2_9EURO|nr:uncharacterized protein PV08_04197 [Exophiala spinifera]KIW17006.1 hypothetical protein PV08_04197 [Exophiala spinifera]
MGFNEWIHNANLAVARSFVGKRFRLDGSGHARERKGTYFFTEIRAGLATFFAMAYIISVNATIVSQSGGTCVCPPDSPDLCDSDPEYMLCVAGVQRDLVTATAAISALTTFCMGLFANMPIALAPGMGLNAYFAYTVVGYHGSGLVPYQVAVTAVFVEGFVFVGLTVLGLRQWLARAIPASIKLATGVGIGLYLTLIGLTYSAGIGAVVGAQATPLELAGCKPEFRDEAGMCPTADRMRNPTMWIGIFCGGFLTVMLMMFRVKGAIIFGILLVVTFHPIEKILVVQEWDISGYGGQFGLAFITFLYVDILDCTGTLYSMARFAGAIDEKTQDFEGSAVAYLVDAFGISIGALFGTPPVTAYIESGAGISEGGGTGLTAMTTGLCFFISIFFAPIFASIPPYATGCVLIIVGSLMAKAAKDINWRYIGDSIPAFLTIAIMPFTYSIAYGLIAGIISYMVINTLVWIIEKASGGRIKPADKEYKDPWTYKIEGGVLPPWVTRAARGKKDFWRPYEDVEHNTGAAPAGGAPGMTLEGKEGGSTSIGAAETMAAAGAPERGGFGHKGSSTTSGSEEGEKVKV